MAVDTSKMTFEEAIEALEKIVEKLQNGNVPLEESMAAFQDGMVLSQFCSQELAQAEETMTKLVAEDGSLKDFDASDSSQSHRKEEEK